MLCTLPGLVVLIAADHRACCLPVWPMIVMAVSLYMPYLVVPLAAELVLDWPTLRTNMATALAICVFRLA